MARGKKELRGQFRDFWDALKKAEAEMVTVSLGRIQSAGDGGGLLSRTSVTNSQGVTTVVEKFAQPVWQASAWLLERRHPDEFAVNAREIKALTKQMKVLAERAGLCEKNLPPLQQLLAALPPDLRRAVEDNLRREEGRWIDSLASEDDPFPGGDQSAVAIFAYYPCPSNMRDDL